MSDDYRQRVVLGGENYAEANIINRTIKKSDYGLVTKEATGPEIVTILSKILMELKKISLGMEIITGTELGETDVRVKT